MKGFQRDGFNWLALCFTLHSFFVPQGTYYIFFRKGRKTFNRPHSS
jgi:hypothetical protein